MRDTTEMVRGSCNRRNILAATGAIAALSGCVNQPANNTKNTATTGTIENTSTDGTRSSVNHLDELPAVTEDSFEPQLRSLVGAKKNRGPEEFISDDENVHDIRDYGAKVDGETNDRDAILNAISAATNESPTGTVYLPAGEISFGSQGIGIDKDHNGLSIVGEGYNTVLKPDTVRKDEPGGGYRAMGLWFTNRPKDGKYEGIKLANFRMVGDRVATKHIGARKSPGVNNKMLNIWLENNPNSTILSLGVSGSLVADITVRGAGEHGIAIGNGTNAQTESEIKPIDPNPLYAKRLHVTDSADYGSGKYAIDVSRGANIEVNGFIAENNRNLGMKVPKVKNVRIYNGLFKNNAKKDFRTLATRWKFKNAYMDNVKVIADDKSSETKTAVSFGQGDWTVGRVLVEGGPDLHRQIVIADRIGELEFKADAIHALGSGGAGIYISADEAPFSPEIKTVISKGHSGCSLDIDKGDVTIENVDIEDHCGIDYAQQTVSKPDFPDIEDTRSSQ